MKDSLIAASIRKASKNWRDWRDVFQHNGTVPSNPLLADPDRFTSFLQEYRVSRTIRSGRHQKFRRKLRDSQRFVKAIQDDTGESLDLFADKLRADFGTRDGKNRVISALSKVAAFVRPERFVAWDAYAKRGVNKALGRAANSRFEGYAQYLSDFGTLWDGTHGQEIRNYVTRNGAFSAVEAEPRFLRRALDVCLMKLGGRWAKRGGR